MKARNHKHTCKDHELSAAVLDSICCPGPSDATDAPTIAIKVWCKSGDKRGAVLICKCHHRRTGHLPHVVPIVASRCGRFFFPPLLSSCQNGKPAKTTLHMCWGFSCSTTRNGDMSPASGEYFSPINANNQYSAAPRVPRCHVLRVQGAKNNGDYGDRLLWTLFLVYSSSAVVVQCNETRLVSPYLFCSPSDAPASSAVMADEP